MNGGKQRPEVERFRDMYNLFVEIRATCEDVWAYSQQARLTSERLRAVSAAIRGV